MLEWMYLFNMSVCVRACLYDCMYGRVYARPGVCTNHLLFIFDNTFDIALIPYAFHIFLDRHPRPCATEDPYSNACRP